MASARSAERVILLLVALSCLGYSSLPTYEEYTVYEELERLLLSEEDGPFNIFTLAEVFYPKVGPSPICVPITYTLICPDESVIADSTDPISCTNSGFNASFLWSQYDLGTPIGPVLLSYAWNGITLRGFDWEDTCNFQKEVNFELNIANITCRSERVIQNALKALTAVVKSYAKHQGKPRSLGSSHTKGYALKWSDDDREAQIFDASHYTLVTMIVVVNAFVFLIVTSMTAYTYGLVYENIAKKKNPNYPLFWSSVVLSFLWNVGPSWLVLSGDNHLVYFSLIVMVPLESIVALLIKKRSDFPVPLLPSEGCHLHKGYNFIFKKVIFTCAFCLVSHVIQTLAILTILVFLTFLVYYLSSIIIAFYLYPSQVLIKVVFLKAVAVCAILNVALLFSNSKFKCGCTWKSFRHDLGYIVTVLAIASFLPILGFLTFIIGGIIFTDSGRPSALQSVLSLLPSVFLVFAAWFTKGRLLPPGTDDADLGTDIINELERGGATHTHTPTQGSRTASLRGSKVGELSYYNSLDPHVHPTDSGQGESGVTGEHTPLLQ